MRPQYNILNGLSDAILLVNSQGTIEFSNVALEGVFGYKASQLIGKSINILIDPEIHDHHKKLMETYFHRPKSRRMGEEKPIYGKHKNGQLLPLEVSLSHVKVEGNPMTLAIVADISDHLKVAEMQKQTMLFYKSLVENTVDHIFHLDTDLKILYINHVSPGLIREDVIGSNLIDLLPDYAKDAVRNGIRQAMKEGTTFTYPMTYPSPVGIINYSTTVTPLVQNGKVVGANLVSRDVTNEEKMKAKLIESNRFIDKLNSYSLNGIYIYNLKEGRNTYINKRYGEILGYSLDDINSMKPEEFFSLFHPDDAQAISSHMNEVLSLRPGEFSEIEYRFKDKKGNWVWCYSRDSGFEYDESGAMVSFIGAFLDLSHQKVVEQRLQDKSNEMKKFVSIASHDVKNPLNSIIQAIDYSVNHMDSANNDGVKMLLGQALDSANRLRELVKSLLDYTAIQEAQQPELVRFESLLNNVKIDLKTQIEEKKAIVETNCAGEINAYRVPMRQLFQNLISNALKFGPESGHPHIKVDMKSENNHILFSVKDNGIGIPPEKAQKVFDFFYRGHDTKKYEGTGLGLANCKRIVEMHNGSIWLESEVGEGTTFYFTIDTGIGV